MKAHKILLLKNRTSRDWRDNYIFKMTYCSFKEPKFSSQHILTWTQTHAHNYKYYKNKKNFKLCVCVCVWLRGVGSETSQKLRALASLADKSGSIPKSHHGNLQLPITPVLGNPMISLFLGNLACMSTYKYIQALIQK